MSKTAPDNTRIELTRPDAERARVFVFARYRLERVVERAKLSRDQASRK